jgi:hypothetical protein
MTQPCAVSCNGGYRLSLSVFITVIIIIGALPRFAAFSSYFGHMLVILAYCFAAFTAGFARLFRINSCACPDS